MTHPRDTPLKTKDPPKRASQPIDSIHHSPRAIHAHPHRRVTCYRARMFQKFLSALHTIYSLRGCMIHLSSFAWSSAGVKPQQRTQI